MVNLSFLAFAFFYYSECYKILGVCHIASRSHHILSTKLFSEIARRGHEVTVITPHNIKSNIENLEIISVEELITSINESAVNFKLDNLPVSMYLKSQTLNYNIIQNFLKSNKKFDAVIIWQHTNSALFSFAYHFQSPLFLFSTVPLFSDKNYLRLQPGNLSYVPNTFTDYTGRITFWQRVKYMYYDVVEVLHHLWCMAFKNKKIVDPEKLDLSPFYKNVSLLLMDTDVSTNDVTPRAPKVVEISGFHTDELKPLPKYLENFLNQSHNGVIIFSMGPVLKSANLPESKRNAIIGSFSKLKENVLWKFDDRIEGLPQNVKVMKWLPQVAILAHPNVKVFISHGGLLSTMESVYFAKPMIGIPIIEDQMMNIAIAASHGYAVQVPYEELTEEKLTWALNEVLNNPKYQENVEKLSLVMRNRPMKPIDVVLFWIEYIVRHKGNPYKYMSMNAEWPAGNVIFTVCVVTYVSTTAIYILLTK